MVVALTASCPSLSPRRRSPVKWASVMVTEVPPWVGPLVGAVDVTAGGVP
jgi:hypothetical protein